MPHLPDITIWVWNNLSNVVLWLECNHIDPYFRLSAKFLVSGSEDQTIKLWKVPAEVKKDSDHLVTLHSSATQWAHEDDINFVAVAPNDQYLASASKDKTAKVSIQYFVICTAVSIQYDVACKKPKWVINCDVLN